MLPLEPSGNCYVTEHIGIFWTAAEEISSFFLRQFPLREARTEMGIGLALEPVATELLTSSLLLETIDLTTFA
jgi:hypothetical protein